MSKFARSDEPKVNQCQINSNDQNSKFIRCVIHANKARHSRPCFRRGKLVLTKVGRGNRGKHWIPGQARNDRLHKIYVVMYKEDCFGHWRLETEVYFGFVIWNLGFKLWRG
jgi:hypothetical protein